MKNFRILLTGGGTGGHVYPLIAIIRSLRRPNGRASPRKAGGSERGNPNLDIRYFGPRDVFSFYLTGEGAQVQSIIQSKLRRYFSWLNFLDILRFAIGVLQSLWHVFWFMPDIVFSKGGTGSLPVLLACRFYGVTIIIHESDSVPSLTNKIAARWAKKIFVGFASAADYFKKINPSAKIIISGNPIREGILGFDGIRKESGKPTILVIGGSQGSVRINNFILENLESLLSKYNIIHQVGSANHNSYISLIKSITSIKLTNYEVFAYLEEKELAKAYAEADLVVARAGAETIFELAALGKPAILIPLPEAAQDHQKYNAYEYAKTGAAVVVEEENLLINLMERELDRILNNEENYQKMSLSAKSFSKPNAAEEIAQELLI